VPPRAVREPETLFKQNPLSFNEMGFLNSHVHSVFHRSLICAPFYHADLGRDKLGKFQGPGVGKRTRASLKGLEWVGASLSWLLKFAVSSHQRKKYL